jgi:hypothetical protein
MEICDICKGKIYPNQSFSKSNEDEKHEPLFYHAYTNECMLEQTKRIANEFENLNNNIIKLYRPFK